MTSNISSKNIAKSRLINVLYMDRTSDFIDNKFMDLMKRDIYKAVSKYIDINEKNIEISIKSNNNGSGSLSAVLNAQIIIDNFINSLRKDKYDKKEA